MLSQFQLPSKLSFTKSLEEQTQVKARCTKKQQAKQLCTNLSCNSQNIFTCLSQYCQCHSNHAKCEQKPIQSILERIRQKMNVKEINISELIESKFDHLIDHLSDVRDRLISQLLLIKEEIRLSKLTNSKKVFLKLVKNQPLNEEQVSNLKDTDEQTFTLSDYKKLSHFISEEIQPCTVSFLDRLEFNLKQFESMSNKSVSQFEEQCNNFFVEFECKQKSWQILAKQEIIILNQVGKVGKQILDTSAIVRSVDQARNLIGFFLPQKIQKIELLFRASQNNFEIKSFFNLYGNESNTLLLCKTNKDKIIGGYTPLSHLYVEKPNLKRSRYQNSEDFYGKDPSNSSFIFSLTNNDKFLLRNSQHAVYRSKDNLRICFGDMQGQLSICDRSNLRAESKSNINSFVKEGDNFGLKYPSSSYYNPKYKGSNGFNVDKQSLMRFNGNAGLFFTTKQWEIWKVYI